MGLAWILNKTVSYSGIRLIANFTSNGTSFKAINGYVFSMYYSYDGGTTNELQVYENTNKWAISSEDYRTIVFEEEPTGNILTWLQENAVEVEPEPMPIEETWILNESVTNYTGIRFRTIFKSNNIIFRAINGYTFDLYYSYDGTINDEEDVYSSTIKWSQSSEEYRTLQFKFAPTGELLTWLQANAVKQANPKNTRIRVNLTNLPNYQSLSAGSYHITAIAKADGYLDSDRNVSVLYTKQ